MDYNALFGYLYWLTGSRTTAIEVTRQARRLHEVEVAQRSGKPTGQEMPVWRLATTIAAGLPEERRLPGWLPLGDGPAAPPLLEALAALPVADRAALLLRYGLNWSDAKTADVVDAQSADALAALSRALDGDADRIRTEVGRLNWPRPTPAELHTLRAPVITDDDPVPLLPPPPTQLGRLAERIAILLVVVVIGWLAWRNLAGSAGDAPPPDTLPMPAPVATEVPTPTPLPPVTDPDVSADAVQWLRENSQRISGATLQTIVGDRRVVIIGDGTWGANGTAEYQRERLHLTRHLIDDLGFDMVILQAAEPESDIANLFMQSTGGGFEALARALAGPWATRELVEALEWLRDREDIGVAGFLPPRVENERLLRNVNLYLRQVDPANAARIPTPATGDSRVLLAYLESRRDVYEPQAALAYRRALSDVRSQVQYEALAAARDRGEAGGLYEQFARENLQRLLTENADRRIVIWADDLNASGLPSLPTITRSLLPEDGQPVVRIGFLFGHGSMTALRTPVSRRAPQMIVHQVAGPLPGSHERVLAAAQIPTTRWSGFLIDVHAWSAAGGWPDEERLVRRNAGSYQGCFPEDYWEAAPLTARYDAVVYVDEVTPAGLLEPTSVAAASNLPSSTLPACVHAPQNLDFSREMEQWSRGGSRPWMYRVRAEAELNRGVVRAIDGSPDGTGTLQQSFRGEGYAGRTVTFGGRCFVDSERAKAEVFVLARGIGGVTLAESAAPLLRQRGLPDCVTSLLVPEGTTRIDLGLRLKGPGEAWIGAVHFRAE